MEPVAFRPDSFLQARGIVFGYPERRGRTTPVLENISFEGRRGDTIAIMGRSGIGKTTLCRILAGLLIPQAGSVYLNGIPVDRPTTQVAISFQESPCFPWLTAAENVAFAHKGNDSAIVDQLIINLGLEAVRGKYPKDLSGGMRQRVAIGRALAIAPSSLILDEPFSALDILTKQQLQQLLKNEQRARNLLAIIVLHSLEDALAVANRVLVLGSHPARILADIPVSFDSEFRMVRDQITDVMLLGE